MVIPLCDHSVLVFHTVHYLIFFLIEFLHMCLLFDFVCLGTEPKASHLLGKHSVTKLHPQSVSVFISEISSLYFPLIQFLKFVLAF
jgi:hypothetical protein